MRRTVMPGTGFGVLAVTPALANIDNAGSCFRGSRCDGVPHDIAGEGNCNEGRDIENEHNPNRFVHGPGVVVRPRAFRRIGRNG